MRIGMVTDSLAALPFEEMLDTAASLGITDLEFPTGGWSSAPHINAEQLLADETARRRFTDAVADRGLRISALNANGNQLHPEIGQEVDEVVHRAVELDSLLEVPTVVLMSGLPAGAPGDSTPNWITTSNVFAVSPSKPNRWPTIIIWPVLETGKNSVNPSTTPKIAATSSECISLINKPLDRENTAKKSRRKDSFIPV